MLSARPYWRAAPSNPPIFHYNENFLEFPVGTRVPSGWLDESSGAWVPSDDGRVIRIVSVDGGFATVDCDGDGAADSGATLSGLGFSSGELARLGQLYTPGQTLMRVPLDHLSTCDFNFNDGPPLDAAPPAPLDRSDDKRRCTCRECDEDSPADQSTTNNQPMPGCRAT